MKTLEYHMVKCPTVWKSEKTSKYKGFVVFYPDLPGCITCGETIESGRKCTGCKKAWLEAALEEGIEIHEPVSLGGGVMYIFQDIKICATTS